jgi:hypothetical protein
MNNGPVGGCGSETSSHPIDTNNWCVCVCVCVCVYVHTSSTRAIYPVARTVEDSVDPSQVPKLDDKFLSTVQDFS